MEKLEDEFRERLKVFEAYVDTGDLKFEHGENLLKDLEKKHKFDVKKFNDHIAQYFEMNNINVKK